MCSVALFIISNMNMNMNININPSKSAYVGFDGIVVLSFLMFSIIKILYMPYDFGG